MVEAKNENENIQQWTLLSFMTIPLHLLYVHTKTQTRRFQVPSFEERFRTDPFSWQISVSSWPNHKN